MQNNIAKTSSQVDTSNEIYSLYKKNDEFVLKQSDSELQKKNHRQLIIVSVVIFIVLTGAIIFSLIPVYKSISESNNLSRSSNQSPDDVTTVTQHPGSVSIPTQGGRNTSSVTESSNSNTIQTSIATAELTTEQTTPIVTTSQQTSTTTPTTLDCIQPANLTLFPTEYNSYKCPNNPINEPTYITLNTSYSFGYPIFQVVACYNTSLVLTCGQNQVIHIYAAYFGLQSNTNTGYCAISSSVVPSACFYSISEGPILSCEFQTTCSISVVYFTFGNPCLGSTYQQLFVQYQCIDPEILDQQISSCAVNNKVSSICPSSLPQGRLQAYSYQPSPLTLKCPANTYINVTCAYFGIDPNVRNPTSFYIGAPSKYYSPTSFSYVATNCNGKNTCTLSTSVSSTIDPGSTQTCQTFQCSLFAQFNCLSIATTTTTITIPSTQKLTTESTSRTCSYTELAVNGTCSTQSPYEPTWPSNSSELYFGYPITTTILCQDTHLILVCSATSNLVIRIYAAYYGVQAATSTSTCVESTNGTEINAKCYVKQGYDVIRTQCEGQSQCEVRVSTATLGGPDLCPTITKQLFVQYQCVDAQVLSYINDVCPTPIQTPPICPANITSNITMSQTWCDGQSMSIACPTNTTITVLCAFYGLDPTLSTSCGISFLTYSPVCYFNSTLGIIQSLCASKNVCSISDITDYFSVFGDPCADLNKQLHVQWICESI